MICARITASPAFVKAGCLMLFVPIHGEVDISGIARACETGGKRICLPRIGWEDRTLTPVLLSRWGDGMIETRHGLREPEDGEVIPIQMIDLVLVPGLAFDEFGGRIGRGAGFYDRFFARPKLRAAKVGVGLRLQLIERVPMEKWDVPLDGICTPDRLHWTGNRTDIRP